MKYQPVLHVMSQTWMVGIIHNHQARNLTLQEVEEVCKKLNASQEQPASQEQSRWRPYDN